jgi:hypothetical protein
VANDDDGAVDGAIENVARFSGMDKNPLFAGTHLSRHTQGGTHCLILMAH